MRIPFPKSIPFRPLFGVLTVTLLIQLVQGTDPVFAVLMLAAQLAAVAAFNRLGGMTHMAGAFCLFAVLPNVTVPELAHLVLGQPGDYSLEHPLATAGACAVFFLGMLSAALLASLTRPAQPYIDRIHFSILELRIASAIACVVSAGIVFALVNTPERVEDGSFLAVLIHFYVFLLVSSIMLATYVRLKVTNGRSAMSWYIAFLLGLALVPGILGASTEGILSPIVSWLVVVAASRHRFSRLGTLVVFGCMLFVWNFAYPFSHDARSPIREAATISEKVTIFVDYVRDPSQFPNTNENSGESGQFGTAKVNVVERFSLLKPIDMLIDADQKVGYTSFARYAPVFLAVVPHVLWPNRPAPITSNELGHKAGFRMNENDTSTGIAIGSPALFFDLGGWLALAVYSIFSFSIFFYMTRRIIGTTDAGVWALVPIGAEAHIAGASSPATIFFAFFMFLANFFVTVAILKMVSYVSQSLISNPVSSGA